MENCNMINVFQPSLGQEEIDAISKVFASNWLGKGNLTSQFEENFGQHLSVDKRHLRSANCCTEGLFNSMQIFDIKSGDEVIMPTISFVGAANSVCSANAKLVFCDVNPRTLNVTAKELEKKITSNTKAIFLIHFGGVPCEMDEILELANSKNIKVIEDSACSVSSRYKGKACGVMGDMGMWSFDAMKILVCGDGSILYLKEEELADKAEKLMYFGLESKSGYSNSVDNKWWEFEISQFGHRSVMNDITAAMALEQLKKLPGFIERRRHIHHLYNKLLEAIPWLEVPVVLPEYCSSSYYFYHIQLKDGNRDNLAAYLRQNDIYTTFRYYPLHLVKYYGINESFSNAEWAAEHSLCLPLHQALTDDEIIYISEKIKEFGKINRL